MSVAVLAALLAGLAVLLAPPASSRSAVVSGWSTPQPRRRGRLGGRRGRRDRADAVESALLVLDGIGPALRAGLSPRAAFAHLASTSSSPGGGLASELAAAAATPPTPDEDGVAASPVAGVWSRLARRSGAAELDLVAAAWTLADTCGVALADAVDLAARLLRESRNRQARLDVLLAGPRATMSLLTLLPLGGPLIGSLFGVDPVSLYAGSPVGTASAVLGLGLLVVGRLWCRALLRRAVAAGRLPAAVPRRRRRRPW